MLLSKCLCGSSNGESSSTHNIATITCVDCGIERQYLDITPEEYFKFYTEKYHSDFQTDRGTATYSERYEHDRNISKLRYEEYKEFLREGMRTLDIGSSNNAFVDLMNERGLCAQGVEIGEEGANHPETTYNEDLLNLQLDANRFELVTLHDVLEHLIDPREYLTEIHRIMSPGGTLVVDFPSFFCQEGIHHWKPVEHLWFLNVDEVTDLIEQHGFDVVEIRYPIPSKFVIYAKVK